MLKDFKAVASFNVMSATQANTATPTMLQIALDVTRIGQNKQEVSAQTTVRRTHKKSTVNKNDNRKLKSGVNNRSRKTK